MPSSSIGFWVARTKNGTGRARVSVPTVTVRSCIASRSALWVFGVARLTSSASTRLAKIGPGWYSNSRRPESSRMMLVPTMSAGIRSGVNWIREKLRSRVCPSERTSIVLPRPGTPSRRMWPPEISAMTVSRRSSFWPTIRRASSASRLFASSVTFFGSALASAITSLLVTRPTWRNTRGRGRVRSQESGSGWWRRGRPADTTGSPACRE